MQLFQVHNLCMIGTNFQRLCIFLQGTDHIYTHHQKYNIPVHNNKPILSRSSIR